MTKTSGALSMIAAIASLSLLAGCGSQVAGGGQPVPQPITAQSAGNGNTTPSAGTDGSSTPITGTSGQGATTAPSGTEQGGQPKATTGSSANTASTPGTSKHSPQGTTKSTPSTSPSGTNQGKVPVTVDVQGATDLTATAVSGASEAGGGFVPASSSVSTVLLPAHWIMQTTQDGGEGTTIRLTNPKDSSQSIVELVQNSARDLVSFYNGQAIGTVHWVIPQQIVGYTLMNPQNPNPDKGIVANLSTGGSIRLDVYLPQSQAAVTEQIINSFVTQASS
ncbi:MAG: hypothetical protein OWT28_10530 [Firmicutes bacterium]|nr:hypothetical protein [Bacillota bacterium]